MGILLKKKAIVFMLWMLVVQCTMAELQKQFSEGQGQNIWRGKIQMKVKPDKVPH